MVAVSISAALLACLFIYLSFRVIGVRKANRIAIGTGGDPALERAMRVHANFAEYVPLTLVLLTLCALRGLPEWIVALFCAVFVLGRLLHAYGVSQVDENYRFRTVGMLLTFGTLALCALSLLVLVFR